MFVGAGRQPPSLYQSIELCYGDSGGDGGVGREQRLGGAERPVLLESYLTCYFTHFPKKSMNIKHRGFRLLEHAQKTNSIAMHVTVYNF